MPSGQEAVTHDHLSSLTVQMLLGQGGQTQRLDVRAQEPRRGHRALHPGGDRQ